MTSGRRPNEPLNACRLKIIPQRFTPADRTGSARYPPGSGLALHAGVDRRPAGTHQAPLSTIISTACGPPSNIYQERPSSRLKTQADPSPELAKSRGHRQVHQLYNALEFACLALTSGSTGSPLRGQCRHRVVALPKDYLHIGHRIMTLRQLFNIKHGFPKDIRISRRLGIPTGERAHQGSQVDSAMRRMFWDHIGWHPKTGVPTQSLLIELGLDDRGF